MRIREADRERDASTREEEMNISVIGAGLAGCEAAYAAAVRGVRVTLFEMKPGEYSPAHKSPLFAELVCSNSFKASRTDSAAGLLKEEMRALGSVCLKAADGCAVPAGGALAVDRERFSASVTDMIKNHPLITTVEKRVDTLPGGTVIIATGPLTDGAFAYAVKELCGGYLHFYDASSPIVTAETLDMSRIFAASRYGKSGGDYLNCPMSKDEYTAFRNALADAETAPLHEFESDLRVYEGCMPIETLASRGEDAIRFGPLKPVGLTDPATGHRPWAAVQLRPENAEKTLYNIVGFQTHLTFPEQKRVFGMIPGLHNAEFTRYGVMHRNSFINSPALLNSSLSLRKEPRVYFAGQITGAEGYMESAATGIIAGINAANAVLGKSVFVPPAYTMIGALCEYVSGSVTENFQPMGANMGILPPGTVQIRDKRLRNAAFARRALSFYKDGGKKDENNC